MPNPDTLHLIVTGKLTPQGDGTYILKTGTPVQWLWTREAAKLYGVSSDTIVRWWRGGFIIGQRIGPRRVRIDADSLAAYVSRPAKQEPQSFGSF
jgi:excisionase family DNA binding protein